MLIPLLTGLLCLPAPRPADLLLERGGRPELSGTTEWLDHGAFRLHYTLSGDDALPPADLDSNGLPDYLDRVIAALDLGAQAYLDQGYRALVPDEGEGGSDALDLYLLVLPVNGYATPVAVDGGYSCFMQIDPGLGGSGEILESVVVHELHHCVQYRYTVNALSWVYEATATYEQYAQVQTPTLQAALDVLWNERLRGAELAFDGTDGRFEYAGFSFLKFLEDRSADRAEVVRLWDELAQQPAWTDALDSLDGDWEELVLDFHTWNAFACSRDDGQHYDQDSHPCTFPATSINTEPVGGDELLFEHGETPGSALYLEAGGGDDGLVPQLDCAEEAVGARSAVRLVAIDADGRSEEEQTVLAPGSGALTAALAGWIAIGVSFGEVPAITRCALSWAEAENEPDPDLPAEDDGEGCACSSGRGAAASPLLLLLALRARRRSSTPACACSRRP